VACSSNTFGFITHKPFLFLNELKCCMSLKDRVKAKFYEVKENASQKRADRKLKKSRKKVKENKLKEEIKEIEWEANAQEKKVQAKKRGKEKARSGGLLGRVLGSGSQPASKNSNKRESHPFDDFLGLGNSQGKSSTLVQGKSPLESFLGLNTNQKNNGDMFGFFDATPKTATKPKKRRKKKR